LRGWLSARPETPHMKQMNRPLRYFVDMLYRTTTA